MSGERADRDLQAALDALPREIEPPVDLWPTVAVQLAPRRRWRARGQALAAALALVALSSGATAWWLRPPPPLAWEERMLTAQAELELELVRRALAPAVQEQVQRELGAIEDAITQLRAALARRPDDPHLTAALGAAHRHRLELLQRAITL